jgi:hypothetical protein
MMGRWTWRLGANQVDNFDAWVHAYDEKHRSACQPHVGLIGGVPIDNCRCCLDCVLIVAREYSR